MKSQYQALSGEIRINYGTYFPFLFVMVLFITSSCNLNEGINPVNHLVSGNEITTSGVSNSNQPSSIGIGNAPTQSGAFLTRTTEGFGLTLVDGKSNLVATIGYPDLPFYCGGEFQNDAIIFQDIIAANHGERIIDIGQGKEVIAKVYKGPLDFNDFSQWCPFFRNGLILAEGTAKLTVNTNDLYLNIDTNNRAIQNAQFNGELLSPDGKIKHLSARILFSWDKEEEYNTLRDLVKNVSVQLN